MKTLALLSLALAACSPITGTAVAADTASNAPEIVRALLPAEGLAVGGALSDLGGRLYGLAGEAGPDGTSRCNSTAMWNTVEHRQHCPGALFSIAIAPGPDGSRDFRVEHAFTWLVDGVNADGYHPYGTLGCAALGAAPPSAVSPTSDHPAGRLCGVTQMGGAAGYGVAFCYDPSPAGDPANAFEVIHHFTGGADGAYPMGAVAVGPDGTVYGTAKTGVLWSWSAAGGFRHVPLRGEVYGGVTLSPDGTRLYGASWIATSLGGGGWYFTADAATLAVESTPLQPTVLPAHGTDNTPIQAPLVLRRPDGASTGTVVLPREWAGATGAGALLVPFGTLWAADDLGPLDGPGPRFANATGAMPNGQLAEGPDGSVYFSAQYGGAFGTGAIARVRLDGSSSLLWSWPDAAYPYGGVTLASDGALWGATFNTQQIWRLPVR